MATPRQVPLPGCWSLLGGRAPALAAGPRVSWDDVQALHLQVVGETSAPLYVVSLTAEGALLTYAQPGERAIDRVRPPLLPAYVLPPAPGGFCDRGAESRIVQPALVGGGFVMLQGPHGIGKTAFVSHIMQDLSTGDFPDGMVYLSARGETYGDLLQELLESLFEIDGLVAITEEEFQRYMAGKRALIAIDDADDYNQSEIEALGQVAPDSAILVAGRNLPPSGAAGVPLRGLPDGDAVALFQQHWGPVPPQDLPLVEDVCRALGNMPLPISRIARAASSQNVPLTQVLQQALPPTLQSDPVRQAFEFVATGLSNDEQQVLGGLVAASGASAEAGSVSAITSLPLDLVQDCLDSLEQEELVSVSAGRYRLDQAFRPHVRDAWTTSAMETQAADYYRRQAHHLTGPFKDPDEDNVVAALEYWFQRSQWAAVLEIAEAMELYLASTGRWGHWRKALELAWRAAVELGRADAEAKIQNQLGVISAAQGDGKTASQFFEGALGLWKRLGNHAGITIAGWNAGQNLWNTMHASRRSAPRILTALLLAAVLIVLLTILWTLAVRPTPEIELTLAAGCDKTYHPGETLDIAIWSSVRGELEIRALDPLGREEYLFGESIRADQEIRRQEAVPSLGGNWRLVAYLNDDDAVDQCGFAVDPETTVLYDFLSEAAGADWMVYSPVQGTLAWCDSSTLRLGFACWREDVILEDGNVAWRVLETRPPLAPGGQVRGGYDLSALTLQPGDRFAARVGFLKGCTQGSVTFSVRYANGGSGSLAQTLAAISDRCDTTRAAAGDSIKSWWVPLPYDLNPKRLYLEVEAGPSSTADQPVWIEAQIERPKQ